MTPRRLLPLLALSVILLASFQLAHSIGVSSAVYEVRFDPLNFGHDVGADTTSPPTLFLAFFHCLDRQYLLICTHWASCYELLMHGTASRAPGGRDTRHITLGSPHGARLEARIFFSSACEIPHVLTHSPTAVIFLLSPPPLPLSAPQDRNASFLGVPVTLVRSASRWFWRRISGLDLFPRRSLLRRAGLPLFFIATRGTTQANLPPLRGSHHSTCLPHADPTSLVVSA